MKMSPFHPCQSDLTSLSCLQVLPPGEVGEVCVAGERLLAQGYAEEEALTASRFETLTLEPPDLLHVAAAPGAATAATARYFRTADLGKLLPGGELLILGRQDLQVKVGGVRVDVAEVEAALSRHPLVAAAAVKPWPTKQVPGWPQLAAYVVLNNQTQDSNLEDLDHDRVVDGCDAVGGDSAGEAGLAPPLGAPPTVNETDVREVVSSVTMMDLSAKGRLSLRQHLAALLPSAALPAAIVAVDALPRSAAGKVLRPQLPTPFAETSKVPQRQGAGDVLSVGTAAIGTAAVGTAADGEPQGAGSSKQYSTSRPEAPHDAATHFSGNVLEQPNVPTNVNVPADAGFGEAHVMRAFASVLQAAHLEPNDDFFLAGGNSLLAMQLAGELSIDVRLVYAYPTARALSREVRRARQVPTGAASLRQPTTGPQPALDEYSSINKSLDDWQEGSETTVPEISASLPAASSARPAKRLRAGVDPFAPELPVPELLMPNISEPRPLPLVEALRHLVRSSTHAAVLYSGNRTVMLERCGAAATGGERQSESSTKFLAKSSGRTKSKWQLCHHPPELPNMEALQPIVRQTRQQQQSEVPSSSTSLPWQCLWRYKLGRCVDAPPVVVVFWPNDRRVQPDQQGIPDVSCSAAACGDAAPEHVSTTATCSLDGSFSEQKPTSRDAPSAVVLTCSHDGDVACLDLATGGQLWYTR